MEKSTIKRIIECTAASCVSFTTGVVLGRFMPEYGLAKKVIFTIGSGLIGGVVGDIIASSSAVTEVSDVVANCFGTSKNDISEEVKEETTDEIFCDGNSEEVKAETTDSESSEEDSDISEESVSFDADKYKNVAVNIYSAMEFAYTYLIARTIFRFFKVKKLLSKIAIIYLSYEILSKLAVRLSVSLLRPDIYMGSKEAIA